jgi:hypothetical protein
MEQTQNIARQLLYMKSRKAELDDAEYHHDPLMNQPAAILPTVRKSFSVRSIPTSAGEAHPTPGRFGEIPRERDSSPDTLDRTYIKNTYTTFRIRSAPKWDAIALSSPYRQYSQPNRSPMIPFKTSVLVIVTTSTGMPTTTILEM